MRRRSPPRTEQELLARAEALRGHTLFEIACALGAPEAARGGLHGKGKAGTLIEAALGAHPDSGKSHDFPDLGVELKTVPRTPTGLPRESTYVCAFLLREAEQMAWESSWVRRKLSRVLWVTTSDARTAWTERMVQDAWMWSPSAAQEAQLRADFEELVGLAAQGRVDALSAALGEVLQVRPKAAHSGVRTVLLTDLGEAVATVPRGFYLRARFVQSVLEQLASG